ncbi:6186_t:CDS:10 [Diversispora eburnea]|uniref:6186_t:CDS:1 n=1 Tax=Diversispora eburnea TaxID=1213867 RepID=A0A9N8ZN56_9GLOM|nr:6186_t:CDS:10 [Diversispora eburnea]
MSLTISVPESSIPKTPESSNESSEPLAPYDFSNVILILEESNFNRCQADCMQYFVRPPFVGISVFINEPTFDESQDRGAHMVSVGILVTPTMETGLYYSNLKQYFDKRGILLNHTDDVLVDIDNEDRRYNFASSSGKSQYTRTRCLSTSETSTNSYQLSISPTHPAHHFPEFVHLCGPNIFLLWKAALLKKRILFYSPPPVLNACYAVYGTCLLANISTQIARTIDNKVEKIKPLFNVGISDIPLIESMEGGYVACTTDQILQSKNNLYDLLVNMPHDDINNNTHPTLIASPGSKLSTKISVTDIRRYRVLLKILASHGLNHYSEEDGENMTDTWRKLMFGDDESSLLNVEGSRETLEIELELIRTVTSSVHDHDPGETIFLYPDHLIQLGLDPHEDGTFVEELAEMYFGKEVEAIVKR